ADLRQPGRAGSARPRRQDLAGRRSLSRTDRRRSQGPGVALQPSLRAIQEGARRNAAADLSRNHGTGAGRHRQDHHRYRRPAEHGCRALSAAAKLAAFGSTAAAAGGRQPMRMSLAGGAIAVVLLIALVVAYSTFFTVYQTKQALVVRLGKPVRVITEPGLNAKIPFIDSVIYIDKRILAIESPAQEVIASSQDKANAGVAQAGERLAGCWGPTPSRFTASPILSGFINPAVRRAPIRGFRFF